jgi:hypothetical protein
MSFCKIVSNESRWKSVELSKEFKFIKPIADMIIYVLSFLPQYYYTKSIIFLQCIFLDYVSRKYKSKTFGGFLEERVELIGFLEEESDNHMIHLGIDINNIEPGADIKVPCDVEIVHIYKDKTVINGWGGRLIMRMKDDYNNCSYLLYGHLSHDLPKVGQVFLKGEKVAKLGDCKENGGWFPHLHVQCMTEYFFKKYINDLEKLDGYFFKDKEFSDYVCDPSGLVFLQ